LVTRPPRTSPTSIDGSGVHSQLPRAQGGLANPLSIDGSGVRSRNNPVTPRTQKLGGRAR
jgi:hypothetical protein